jgi:ADP-ribosyl-[dinitrogen reductase] hydrolase
MNTLAVPLRRERILGALWGSLVGDALGVPVEFKDRATVQREPIKDMRGFGSHNQPPGTWSDDSSLLLCSTDSLVHHDFDTGDMGKRFVRWYREELWTPHGKVFNECVLKAVNLGDDTDTTGCVAGGLAGVQYGLNAIPKQWLNALARHQEVEALFARFVEGMA